MRVEIGRNGQGVEADEIIFAPAYNITREVEKVVNIFVESVEEVLRERSRM